MSCICDTFPVICRIFILLPLPDTVQQQLARLVYTTSRLFSLGRPAPYYETKDARNEELNKVADEKFNE